MLIWLVWVCLWMVDLRDLLEVVMKCLVWVVLMLISCMVVLLRWLCFLGVMVYFGVFVYKVGVGVLLGFG